MVEMKKIIGIYFLFNGENVCYIGQSTNIFNRISDHSRDKTFTHYGYIECGEAELNDFEKKMIAKYLPDLNKCLSKKYNDSKKTMPFVSVLNKETKRFRKYYNVFDIKRKYQHVSVDRLEEVFKNRHKVKYEDHLLLIY